VRRPPGDSRCWPALQRRSRRLAGAWGGAGVRGLAGGMVLRPAAPRRPVVSRPSNHARTFGGPPAARARPPQENSAHQAGDRGVVVEDAYHRTGSVHTTPRGLPRPPGQWCWCVGQPANSSTQPSAVGLISVDPGRYAGGYARHNGVAADGDAPGGAQDVLILSISPACKCIT
jgi:hypothetical protein